MGEGDDQINHYKEFGLCFQWSGEMWQVLIRRVTWYDVSFNKTVLTDVLRVLWAWIEAEVEIQSLSPTCSQSSVPWSIPRITVLSWESGCQGLDPASVKRFYCILFFINLFIYFWLHWVFVAVRGLSLVGLSGGCSSLWCTGFSLWWLLLLQSMASRHLGFSSCGSQVLEHRLSSCGART